MTSTPDCLATTNDTCSPDGEARDRFLALVADARAAVLAALAPPPEADTTGHSHDVDSERCGRMPEEDSGDVAAPSPTQRLEKVVLELFAEGGVELAQVHVVR